LASDLSVGEAVRNYIAALEPAERPTIAPELQRFSRWFGAERQMRELDPIQLERYQDQMSASGVDPSTRLEPLRQFLSHARAKKLIDVALAVHVRVRRRPASERARSGKLRQVEPVEITQAGYDQLQSEYQRLETEDRPRVTGEVARARADGDLRENAPYHAAREKLQEVDRRLNEIKEILTRAKIISEATGDRASLGTTVVVTDLDEDEQLRYTLVGPGEVDRRGGRISVQSPVGQALVDRAVGDVVEVRAPAGVMRYRVESIERAG
jgi:transcription elongation factor GreA